MERMRAAVAARAPAWALAWALACAVVVAVSGTAAAQRGPVRVAVDEVVEVEVAETQPLIARLVAVNEGVVATRIPGIVGSVAVEVGDRVAEADPLMQLDTELLSIELQGAEAMLLQAEAGLNAAKAGLELAEQAYARIRELRNSAAFSQGRFEDLASEVARARAELARAEGAVAVGRSGVRGAEYRLRNATVRAPFAGVVVARAANPGAYVAVGAPVATLIDDRALEIEADVPTEIVAALDPGEAVATVLDDGTPARATVRAAVPTENPSTRTRPVRFTLAAEGSAKPLAVGQTVTVMAPVGVPRAVLSVAKDALVQQDGGWIVYAVEDGTAVPRPVELGAAVAGRYEVDGDLAPGALVIVRGNERLRPGQAVSFDDPRVSSVAAGSAVRDGGTTE